MPIFLKISKNKGEHVRIFFSNESGKKLDPKKTKLKIRKKQTNLLQI